MALPYIITLALIQGLTEFLPVSSSGHLVLAHEILSGQSVARWQQDVLMDIAVHVGTLLSVLVYFRKDVIAMLSGLGQFTRGRRDNHGARLISYILIGSAPVICAGLALHLWAPLWLRSVEVMAWATLFFGVILWIADHTPDTSRSVSVMGWRDAVLIGLAQVLALIPGTSRSGITMTAGRALGFSRTESAHFSLLLAIVAIAGAGALGAMDLWQSGDLALSADALLAAVLAFFSGWIAIAAMMKFLEKASFTVFAIYRVVIGSLLLVLIYSGVLV